MTVSSLLRRWLMAAAVLWVAGLAAPTAQAQLLGSAQQVTWTAEAPPVVAQGDTFTVRLRAQIADGWKMYALDSPPPSRAVNLQWDSLAAGFAPNGPTRQSPPQRGYAPNFKKDVTYFTDTATLRAPMRTTASASTGARSVTGVVEYMVCDPTMCLPPTRTTFNADLRVIPGQAPSADAQASPVTADATTDTAPATPSTDASAPKTTPSTTPPAASSGDAAAPAPSAKAKPAPTTAPEPSLADASGVTAGANGGLWGFLLLAIGAGAAALLTPCVFPMIPLTVSYFTKHTGGRAEAVRMAGWYGVAIIATFTGLGVLMALLVGASGAQSIAANPWVNLFIGSIFVIFALSLLGLFELRLPNRLINYVNSQGEARSGMAGVVFMGLTLTLVSFSCTAPFVGGLLAATAGGAWFYPVVGMAAFSATFATPFIGFALFPHALERLPKSGEWMNVVKVTLGFVELAAALKFLSNADLVWGTNLLSRPLAIALTVVIFFLAGLYLIGKLRLAHHPPPASIGVGRLLMAVGFFGTALYLLPGLLGAPLGAADAYLPPRQASDVSLLASTSTATSAPSHAERWHTDAPKDAFEQARAAGEPLFIDFTGYTCTNCRAMEANVFPKPAVARQFDAHYTLLRLYTDGDEGPRFQRMQLRMTGTTALPTYAVVDPFSRTVLAQHSGTASVDAFADFLAQGRAAFAAQQPLAQR
ncbi:protein-disulfide reductase DsbD family protein [Salisaeta longa]|uniref:protein-disulfide reductase DsbD family protein n=1 Tax=Salisaeta longa TaxID=503170 RepID=UPI0006864633|nr:protein-disulfide reductase DsbD [Salisaeta longa]